MKQVGVYNAKTHLTSLLDEVEAGTTIEITRHGRPVARLVPLEPQKRDVAATIAALAEFRKGKRLDGLSIRELIDEGRRY